MSGTDAIMEASNALSNLIGSGNPNVIGQGILLDPPQDSNNSGDARFSLWLYRVIENEHQKNVPARRNADQANPTFRRPALVLDLYYLLTPFGGTEVRRQERLGQAMQRVYAWPIVDLAPGPPGPDALREQLHIQLFRMALEELTRIWEALNQSFRLSVVYQVRFVRLDVVPERAPRPVTDRRIDAPHAEALP
jgi:hypothetical protein